MLQVDIINYIVLVFIVATARPVLFRMVHTYLVGRQFRNRQQMFLDLWVRHAPVIDQLIILLCSVLQIVKKKKKKEKKRPIQSSYQQRVLRTLLSHTIKFNSIFVVGFTFISFNASNQFFSCP
jgi:hypothetical protein